VDFLRSIFPSGAAPGGDDTDLDITGALVWASHRGQATTLKVGLPSGEERHYEVRRAR
jgi:hypothetical protein